MRTISHQSLSKEAMCRTAHSAKHSHTDKTSERGPTGWNHTFSIISLGLPGGNPILNISQHISHLARLCRLARRFALTLSDCRVFFASVPGPVFFVLLFTWSTLPVAIWCDRRTRLGDNARIEVIQLACSPLSDSVAKGGVPGWRTLPGRRNGGGLALRSQLRATLLDGPVRDGGIMTGGVASSGSTHSPPLHVVGGIATIHFGERSRCSAS